METIPITFRTILDEIEEPHRTVLLTALIPNNVREILAKRFTQIAESRRREMTEINPLNGGDRELIYTIALYQSEIIIAERLAEAFLEFGNGNVDFDTDNN